jgi:hypothetical protein
MTARMETRSLLHPSVWRTHEGRQHPRGQFSVLASMRPAKEEKKVRKVAIRSPVFPKCFILLNALVYALTRGGLIDVGQQNSLQTLRCGTANKDFFSGCQIQINIQLAITSEELELVLHLFVWDKPMLAAQGSMVIPVSRQRNSMGLVAT